MLELGELEKNSGAGPPNRVRRRSSTGYNGSGMNLTWSSAVALDGGLDARQTLAEVIGGHDRHQFDLGAHTKEEPLGDFCDLGLFLHVDDEEPTPVAIHGVEIGRLGL